MGSAAITAFTIVILITKKIQLRTVYMNVALVTSYFVNA